MADRLDDERLGVTLKRVVIGAIDEAARRGSSTVEAEHLLLAISAGTDVAGTTLAEFGLDHAGVEAALRQEREQALRAAGIQPVAEERLRATRNSRPGWGASLREAMRRADHRARRDRGRAERERLAVADTLLGILRADLGTVPRALAYAGVDRRALITRLEQL
ncbi:Clp protease N-terminal domain-containing protein [Agromyces ramosus]|jgi:ATP-dependent Clp protease ATP-binding subunit ClpA|uniref:Clp protease N-terminal domain-containing protein n=1 Tax=Agromyces ramosus TaxID=33879 RepID=UPI00102AE758|nr:Clp protease N-terminal domain-containing protein [Agromyces ramosus]